MAECKAVTGSAVKGLMFTVTSINVHTLLALLMLMFNLQRVFRRIFLMQMKIGMAATSVRQVGSHVAADVIKDVRAKLRPPEVDSHVDDVRRVDTLECDKANARVGRLQRRQLRRCCTLTSCVLIAIEHN